MRLDVIGSDLVADTDNRSSMMTRYTTQPFINWYTLFTLVHVVCGVF